MRECCSRDGSAFGGTEGKFSRLGRVSARMARPRLVMVLALLGVIATACGAGAASPTEVGDELGTGAAQASCAAEILDLDDDLPGGDAVTPEPCPPLDPDADPSVFAVEQISSTAREDVPSALDDRHDPSFPEPLIEVARIRSGGPPPDGIPPLDDPRFQNAAAVTWLAAAEPVLAIEVNGEARAYPIQIMTWHELVNDTIAGVPVTISYCPLCNSALAYDRRLGDRVLDFGTSGRLFNSSLVMYDRQTETLWTHFDGRAVVGVLTGAELETFPISTTSWEDFRTAHPDGLVLSRETGFSRSYGRNPYEGYDNPDTRPFLFDGDFDSRLAPKARVIVVRDDEDPAVLVTLDALRDAEVIEFEAHGRDLIAVLDPGTSSPLDSSEIDLGYDQGASGVFVDDLDGEDVSLTRVEGGFLDENSGIVFNVFGDAVDGSGVRLELVEHLDTFWFAIAAFEPDVEIAGS